jgi:hypothetical protein
MPVEELVSDSLIEEITEPGGCVVEVVECEHGTLKRKCLVCELQDELVEREKYWLQRIAEYQSENERLKDEKASYRVEPASVCGDCMGYEYGKSLPRDKAAPDKGRYWYPGSCNIEDVSDELPHDAPPPKWCPLRTAPVLIVLKEVE